MARHPRIEYAGAVYHVTARGNEKRRIFFTSEDRQHFLKLLSEAIERYEATLYAYVLMENHYHLVVQTEHPNLQQFMHFVNTAYAVWMNKRNQRTGHVFEGRYKAIVMEEEGYLLSVTGYVHLNPARVRGGRDLPIGERLRHVEGYLWSSCADYTRVRRKKREPIVSCNRVWGELHARTRREGRQRYRDYIRGWLRKEEQQSRKPKRKREEAMLNPLTEVSLGCFLGGDEFRDFIRGLLSKEEELSQELVGYRRWRKDVPMKELLAKVAEVWGASIEDVMDTKRPNQARDAAMYLCREVGEKKLREIGEMFGIRYAAVSLAINRVKEKAKRDTRHAKQVSGARRKLINILKT